MVERRGAFGPLVDRKRRRNPSAGLDEPHRQPGFGGPPFQPEGQAQPVFILEMRHPHARQA
jgi:hypothetical protein